MKNPKMDTTEFMDSFKHLYLYATSYCYRTEHLLSLFVDGQLTPDQESRLESHLASCQSCTNALNVMKATNVVLAGRKSMEPPAYLSERLRQAIAIEATRPVVTSSTPLPNGLRLTLGGASFAAIAVFSVVIFQHLQPTSTLPAPHTGPNSVTITSPSVKTNIASTPMLINKKITHTFVHRQIGEMTASVPMSDHEMTNPLKLAIPRERIDHFLTLTKVGARKISPESKVKAPITTQASGPMLASNLHTSPVSPNVSTIIPTVPLNTVPVVQPAVTVADNAGQIEHPSLGRILKSLALSTQSAIESHVAPSQSEVQLADAPGVPLVGHDIDR